MASKPLQTKRGPTATLPRTVVVVVMVVAFTWMLGSPFTASAETDLLQRAVNYIFTGRVDPQDAPEIVDRASCVVIVPNSKFQGYIRYYLGRFRMEDASFDKEYSGSRAIYQLDVKGDDIIIEYLHPDKKSVTQRYRSAQILLPGELDQTQKAFKIIFADYCKPKRPTPPF